MRRMKADISQEWSHETNRRISQRTDPAPLKKSLQTDSCQGGWRAVVKKKDINVDFLNNAMQW